MSVRVTKQDDFDFDQDDMERLVRDMEPRVLEAFLRAVLIAQQENSLDELADLAVEGRLLEFIDEAATAGAESLADLVNTVIIESGQTVAGGMTEAFGAVVSFDQVNTRAVDIMRENRFRIVREFVDEQRLATRSALTDGIRRGLNPRAQARNFRNSIGLTAFQQQTVENFRRLLEQGSSEALQRQLRDRRFDPTVRRAVRGEIVLTEAQIDRMVGRYRERLVRFRSEVIARTESLRAVHEGTEEAFRQALVNGALDSESIVRTWHTARDTRVRDSHQTMNGQERPVGEAFISGTGNRLRFPGDIDAPASETIQCRCSVSTRVRRLRRRVV